jgi:ribosomal protein L32
MVKTCSTSNGNPETVKTLTVKLKKLTVKFDRTAYKAAYDKVYFKRTAVCPKCGEIKVRHMLKRHMKTSKCALIKRYKDELIAAIERLKAAASTSS